MLEQGNYIQPKVIDIMHSSPDKHFLHNFIAQHNEALNIQIRIKNISENPESEDKIHLQFVFNAADHLQGHSSRVHGGLLATLIDKKPVKTNHDYMITAEIEGRKIFLKATRFDHDKTICTEATGLFLTVKWEGQMRKNALKLSQQFILMKNQLKQIKNKKNE